MYRNEFIEFAVPFLGLKSKDEIPADLLEMVDDVRAGCNRVGIHANVLMILPLVVPYLKKKEPVLDNLPEQQEEELSAEDLKELLQPDGPVWVKDDDGKKRAAVYLGKGAGGRARVRFNDTKKEGLQGWENLEAA